MNEFLELLKKFKNDNDFTQEELGKKLNLDKMTIFRWEKGISLPSREKRKEVENYINDCGTYLDPYELLTKEIKSLQEKIDVFTNFLKRFHE